MPPRGLGIPHRLLHNDKSFPSPADTRTNPACLELHRQTINVAQNQSNRSVLILTAQTCKWLLLISIRLLLGSQTQKFLRQIIRDIQFEAGISGAVSRVVNRGRNNNCQRQKSQKKIGTRDAADICIIASGRRGMRRRRQRTPTPAGISRAVLIAL